MHRNGTIIHLISHIQRVLSCCIKVIVLIIVCRKFSCNLALEHTFLELAWTRWIRSSGVNSPVLIFVLGQLSVQTSIIRHTCWPVVSHLVLLILQIDISCVVYLTSCNVPWCLVVWLILEPDIQIDILTNSRLLNTERKCNIEALELQRCIVVWVVRNVHRVLIRIVRLARSYRLCCESGCALILICKLVALGVTWHIEHAWKRNWCHKKEQLVHLNNYANYCLVSQLQMC